MHLIKFPIHTPYKSIPLTSYLNLKLLKVLILIIEDSKVLLMWYY